MYLPIVGVGNAVAVGAVVAVKVVYLLVFLLAKANPVHIALEPISLFIHYVERY